MKSRFLILGIIAVLLTSPGCRSEDVGSVVKVYYIPIGVETYIPITTENIEAHSTYVELGSGDKRYKKLTSIIDKAATGAFDENAVRAKILTDGQAIYVDNSGGLKLRSSTKKLSARELEAAVGFLDSISRR